MRPSCIKGRILGLLSSPIPMTWRHMCCLTWNHRKQNVGLSPRLEVKRVAAAENLLRPVESQIVPERADAGDRVQARELERRAGIFVILAAHREGQPVARGNHDAEIGRATCREGAWHRWGAGRPR